MKKNKIIALILGIAILGLSSCAQSICPAYAKVDKPEKKEKKEGQF